MTLNEVRHVKDDISELSQLETQLETMISLYHTEPASEPSDSAMADVSQRNSLSRHGRVARALRAWDPSPSRP